MSPASDAYLLKQTASGPVRGRRDGRILNWRGIPYAAAPAGGLRFRAPRPPEPWSKPLYTTQYGPIPPQHTNVSMPPVSGFTMAEDCLSVNVWAPEPDGTPKPVMVYVHGGAYFYGYAGQPLYNGRRFVERGEVVFVSFNYRLGALGFLDFRSFSTPEHEFEANLGLLDQLAALEWVRDNIAEFGGDPGQVTLFGESAGASSVTTLMTSPRSEGLFHRAIAESAPATSVYGPERAARVAGEFLEILGIPPQEAYRLRDVDTLELVAATDTLVAQVAREVPGTLAVAPVVDGEVVPDYPVRSFRTGNAMPIPLIIGTNRDEASLFRLMRSPLMPISQNTLHEMFTEVAGGNPELEVMEAQITGAYRGYPGRRAAMEVSRDAGFRMPSIWLAEAHSSYAPTWMYRFDQAPPLLKLLGIGATHAAELLYVFGNFSTGNNVVDLPYRLSGKTEAIAISTRMQDRWLAFAKTGDPECTSSAASPEEGGRLTWPQYKAADRATLIIDKRDTIEHDPEPELRVAWGPRVLGFR
jgi:para-nitrobenzyl esterase